MDALIRSGYSIDQHGREPELRPSQGCGAASPVIKGAPAMCDPCERAAKTGYRLSQESRSNFLEFTMLMLLGRIRPTAIRI